MRAFWALSRTAAVAGLLILAGCGEEPLKNSEAPGGAGSTSKGEGTIKKASEKSEIQAFAPGTGYKGEGDGGTAPAK